MVQSGLNDDNIQRMFLIDFSFLPSSNGLSVVLYTTGLIRAVL